MRPALALAGWLLTGPLLAASPCESGPPAAAGAGQAVVLQLDFDGDGRQDRAWFLPAGAVPEVRGRATDPWRRVQRPPDPQTAMLVVDRGRGSAACVLIQNRRFFATPIWEDGPPPVGVLQRSSAQARTWRGMTRGWRGEGVLLGTEAGVDLLLYWDGRQPRIAQGRDLP